jgi:acetyl esterase
MTMALHPSAQMMLEFLESAGFQMGPDISPDEARARMTAATANPLIPRQQVHAVADRTIPNPDGPPIPVRIYRPSDASVSPIVVWFHGGGWVVGNLETHDQICRELCAAVGAIVVSVDYRLAPEARFPAAVDDCATAWVWVNEHAGELGGDPARIALGGDSAGGNLAAVVTLLAREEGMPLPKLQLLVYPVTDHEFESASMIDNAKGYFLEADGMRWFWDLYARTPDDFDDWRLSPLRASSVDDLPPAVVITAEYDPLRDQGEAYGRRLQDAGVRCDIVRGVGVMHGFFGMQAFMPPAKEAWDVAINALQDALGITE